ncbi:response regulator [archaeon]|jgi:CheY-like chemotaxis protein|nr:response regulator [archaeon]
MKKKVLIIDDDKEDLGTMKSILEKEGCEVSSASDGAKALEILKEDGFSLVLIDIKMPTLSGYDLLRLLRERLNHKVKMIYVSIVPEQEVDMDDVDGFVQKPFSPETLLNKVKEVL